MALFLLFSQVAFMITPRLAEAYGMRAALGVAALYILRLLRNTYYRQIRIDIRHNRHSFLRSRPSQNSIKTRTRYSTL
jgi:hypothetical protein